MRTLATGAVLAALAAGAVAPVAAAQEPQDLVVDGIRGIAISQLRPRHCPELTLGTVGLPESELQRAGADRGNGLAPDAPSDAPATLPTAVPLRSDRATYNRRYWFALDGGHVYYRSNAERTGIVQPWRRLGVPACFAGRVRGIAADDDELLAIDDRGWIFTMDGALGDPVLFNWSSRWGPLFWTGAGHELRAGVRAWSWSVLSLLEDGTYTDTAGNPHPVGEAKVSHIWLLDDTGRRLTYQDPWLPHDSSYEMCGPHRGRFRATALSASGSSIFIASRRGDLFTRLFDFDMSGPDGFFEDYSYEDQRGRAGTGTIQLPPPGWVEHPKVPGRITDAISISKVGTGSIHRTLRVEGVRGSATGYWEKDVTELAPGAWRFHPTGLPLAGRLLRTPRRDTSAVGLARSEDRAYAGTAGDVAIEVPDFNVYCSPARLRVALPSGRRLELVLHVDDQVRQSPRARGLDDVPRAATGTIAAPQALLEDPDPAVRDFVARHLTGRFTTTPLRATLGELRFPDLGWSLRPR